MLGIVILNYENWGETVTCLNTIYKYKPVRDSELRIYVVDNGSRNEPTEEFLIQMNVHNEIQLLKSKENLGFARGNNIGIHKAREDSCDYVIVSNSDIYYQKDSLDELVRFYDTHTGICYPKIYDLQGNVPYIPYSYDTSLMQIYLRHTILGKIFKRQFKNLCERSIDMESEVVIENYLNAGSCFVIDKSSLDLIKELDDHTFLYYEEMILSKRAHEKGIHIYYCPSSKVIHAIGKSTGEGSPFSKACMYQSAIYYARHYLHKSRIAVFPLYLYFCMVYFVKAFADKRYKGGFRDFNKRIKTYF